MKINIMDSFMQLARFENLLKRKDVVYSYLLFIIIR